MRFVSVSSTSYDRLFVFDEQHLLKDVRTIADPSTRTDGTAYRLSGRENLDVTAVNSYGAGNEYRWFQIADRNAQAIVGWKGDFTYLVNLAVP